MAEVFGASKRLPQIKLNVTATKQITRFIWKSPQTGMNAGKLGLEDSTTGAWLC
jgi:hypothetical protein